MIEQDIENGSYYLHTGGYDYLRISLGLDRDQRLGPMRSESRNLSGLPYRLVHETFGWIGQDTEDGYDLSHAGGTMIRLIQIKFSGAKIGIDVIGATCSLGNTAPSRT
jgi:hypothetical protein